MGALDGLRVVDLSPTRVGAQVGQVLADFGADVVWVEPPGGSALRAQSTFPFLARGKRAVTLDVRSAAGLDGLRSLTDGADVLIESFRPGVAERLGFGFDELAAVNPRLIYTSITGFGRLGPYAAAPGYEGLVMAKLGVFSAFQTMHAGAHPPFVSVPFCTFPASQMALHGTLAALFERERSGHGQRVDVNLAQGFAALDTWAWFVRIINERWPDAYPSAQAFDAEGRPASPFPFMLLVALTKDGRWLQFAQVAPHLFAALMKALGLDWMFTDPQWKGIPVIDDADRRHELWVEMLRAARSKTLAEWEAIFEADPNVFAELFRNGPEVLEHPQLVHDEQVVDVDDGDGATVRLPGPVVVLRATPAVVDRPPPALSADGDPTPGWTDVADDVADDVAPDSDRPPSNRLPLEGVTVLELAVLYAAPFGATLLTDLGARVIKIEALQGDPIRMMIGFPEAAGAKVMQGKDSVCLDLGTPEGLAIVHRLAERADLVLQGFRAGVAERLGVDGDTLCRLNPDLVYLHAPGYGAGPPNGHRPAFAPSIAAAGGVARANVGPSVPEHPGLDLDAVQDGSRRLGAGGTAMSAQADGFAAVGVATSLLLGLLARERGAGGQQARGSMLATAAHAMAGHVVAPGEEHPDADLRGLGARYRVYDTTDGWVFLAAPGAREWPALAAALADHVDLAGDRRFADEAARQEHDTALADVLAAVFAGGGKDDWERDLLAAGVGCVAVTTSPIEAMLCSDEFGRASGFIVDVEHPVFEHHPRLAPLVRFSRSATQAKPGVLAGSATDQVLAELGYTAEEIHDLRDRKIVG